MDQAFARGDRCYAYVEDGTLGAYTWYSTDPTPLQDGLVATFHPDYIYMYKAFTVPAFRGRRLCGIGVTQAFQALMREGTHKGLVCYIEVHNQPSLKALRRIGFKLVGTGIVCWDDVPLHLLLPVPDAGAYFAPKLHRGQAELYLHGPGGCGSGFIAGRYAKFAARFLSLLAGH